MNTSEQILKQYFGYDSFRHPQADIIQSVLNGNDTMALLPTGGGKSLCFQIPALINDGICIVVSPLIALMKDQVAQLKKRNIKAAAIFSGLTYSEIDIILDNCQFGYYKFLYVSPERLKTELFLERFKRMKVNLLAIDEAHCVSQWGYDFRPPYLEIAEIRKHHPNVPVLALTASATIAVQADIIDKLQLKHPAIFKKSFKRDNISFVVRREEAKLNKLIEIIQKLKGSGIIYVRNRNKTKDVATYLCKNDIPADFYHAGLTSTERHLKQANWTNNKVPVIVCTNAFGMGIDKPDVRYVIHLDIPESLEAYYQEAGRAGRDGNSAYAVLLYSQADIDFIQEKTENKFPPIAVIKRVYNALCNHFKIAVGSGYMLSYTFDIAYFCKQFNLDSAVVLNCIDILTTENYLQLNEGVILPSRAMFKVDKYELYKFEVAHSSFSPLIKSLLRTYGGIIEHYTKINEQQLSRISKIPVDELVIQLNKLHKHKILSYIPSNDKPTILMLNERLHDNNLRINTSYLKQRQSIINKQVQAIIGYTENNTTCRQRIICNYFDDTEVLDCNRCDICIENKKKLERNSAYINIKQDILQQTKNDWVKISDILPKNMHFTAELYKDVIRILMDEKVLIVNDKNEIKSA